MQEFELRPKNYCTKDHPYKVAEARIEVPNCDTDIHLLLPDGRVYTLQYRPETDSMDICFHKNNIDLKQSVHCINADLSNGKVVDKKQNLIECEQVTIL